MCRVCLCCHSRGRLELDCDPGMVRCSRRFIGVDGWVTDSEEWFRMASGRSEKCPPSSDHSMVTTAYKLVPSMGYLVKLFCIYLLYSSVECRCPIRNVCSFSNSLTELCPNLCIRKGECPNDENFLKAVEVCTTLLSVPQFLEVQLDKTKAIIKYRSENFAQTRKDLQQYFQQVTLYLTLQNCSESYLPNGFFQSLKLGSLVVDCNLTDIGDALLDGMSGLTRLTFVNTLLEDIPTTVSLATNLKFLMIRYSRLRTIGNVLQNMTELKRLIFLNNEIESISREAFVGLGNLQVLELSYNKLTTIEEGTFDSLVNIKELFLDYNHLQHLDGTMKTLNPKVVHLNNNRLENVINIFSNMSNVKILALDHNPLKRLPPNLFTEKNFSQLRQLTLRNTSLTDIDRRLFSHLKLIRTFDLRENNISEFHPSTFAQCQNLDRLKLQRNNLQNLDKFLVETAQIRFLYLESNKLVAINTALQNAEELLELFLGDNLLSSIKKEDFLKQGQLIDLSLWGNGISVLSSDCFEPLKTLTLLDLSRNRIQSLNNSLVSLTSVKYLNLSFNEIETLSAAEFSEMKALLYFNIRDNKLNSIAADFKVPANLKTLNIANNALKTIGKGLLHNNTMSIFIQGNPLECNCSMHIFLELLKSTRKSLRLADNPVCSGPAGFTNSRIASLELEDFTSRDNCIKFCRCSCEYSNLYLNCSEGEFPSPPLYISSLQLPDNKLKRLKDFISSHDEVIGLNYENNNLTSLKDIKLPSRLRKLQLANNQLNKFPVEDVKGLQLELVTLSRNPWICDCETVGFSQWLSTHKSVVADINSTLCVDGKEDLKNRVIAYLSVSELCSNVTSYSLIVVGIMAVLLVLAMVAIAYSHYSINIKIWLYSHGVTWVKEDDLDQDKVFDAFISYSSYDETFIINELLPSLEKGDVRYNLCLHYRNFQPGEYIQDNIIEAVKSSKRTVMLLTRNFLRSEWCRLEFRAAYTQVLKDKVHRLIIIRHGDLPGPKDMDPVIQAYLDSTTYLQWGDKYFWNKLRFALPKKQRQPEIEMKTTNLLTFPPHFDV